MACENDERMRSSGAVLAVSLVRILPNDAFDSLSINNITDEMVTNDVMIMNTSLWRP